MLISQIYVNGWGISRVSTHKEVRDCVAHLEADQATNDPLCDWTYTLELEGDKLSAVVTDEDGFRLGVIVYAIEDRL